MIRFICVRLLQSLIVFWCVATAVFFAVDIIGDPAALMLPQDASPAQVQELRHSLGLDASAWHRYGDFMTGLLHGDLGTSVWTQTSVMSNLAHYFPPTFLLAVVTTLCGLVVGVVLGVVAALKPTSVVDRIVTFLAYVAVSFPDFWLGLLLIAFFAVHLRLLPTSGYGTPEYFVLPVLTLVARPIGRLAETTKVALVAELGKEYVYVARAKGLDDRTVVVRHALRNSLISVVTLVGDEVAALVAGSVAVEVIFAWPGTGFLSYQAVQQRDPSLIVGIVLAVCAFVLAMNVLMDVIYRWLDPRIIGSRGKTKRRRRELRQVEPAAVAAVPSERSSV